jgi:hypothetical protein
VASQEMIIKCLFLFFSNRTIPPGISQENVANPAT